MLSSNTDSASEFAPITTAERDPWRAIREFSAARIGLGQCGASIPTTELMSFRLAAARAKDCVAADVAGERICASLSERDLAFIQLTTEAPDLRNHLLRPDMGRRIDPKSLRALQDVAERDQANLCIVVADGLSSPAVARNAIPLLDALLPHLKELGFFLAPIAVLSRGRVAAGDVIARALNVKSVIVLIGERPGLAATDSLSAYITWDVMKTTSDADRNCISNIRPAGLTSESAAEKIAYLMQQAQLCGRSGVGLKDNQHLQLS